MAFMFKLARPLDIRQTFLSLKEEAVKYGISFEGDERHGCGRGYGFEGSYNIGNQFVEITVHKKPFVVSDSRIEKEVRNYWAKIVI